MSDFDLVAPGVVDRTTTHFWPDELHCSLISVVFHELLEIQNMCHDKVNGFSLEVILTDLEAATDEPKMDDFFHTQKFKLRNYWRGFYDTLM